MRLFRSFALLTVGLCLAATPVLAAPSAVPPAIAASGHDVADVATAMAAHLQASPRVAIGTNAAAGAVSTDQAKIALGAQVLGNLHIYDIFMIGFKKGFLEDPQMASWPPADRDLLLSLLTEEMGKRKDDMLRAMAATSVDAYSTDQLNQLVALSKIKFVQDLFLYAADQSGTPPDANSMTADEQTLFNSLMSQQWVAQFFKFDTSAIEPIAEQAYVAATTRFAAAKHAPAK
jgi:hypothetical protein